MNSCPSCKLIRDLHKHASPSSAVPLTGDAPWVEEPTTLLIFLGCGPTEEVVGMRAWEGICHFLLQAIQFSLAT